MRQLGSLPDERPATRLSDYLLTLGIETRTEQTADGWILWVYNEDRLPQAREELAVFLQKPDDPRYSTAVREANAVRQEAARKQAAARRNTIEMRDRWNAVGTARSRPLTTALIVISVLASLLSEFGKNLEITRWLTVTDFSVSDGRITWIPTFYDIQHGEIWRAFTPVFLHFGWLHLLFDMYMLYVLGGVLEWRYGTRRLVLAAYWCRPLPILVEYYMSRTPFHRRHVGRGLRPVRLHLDQEPSRSRLAAVSLADDRVLAAGVVRVLPDWPDG